MAVPPGNMADMDPRMHDKGSIDIGKKDVHAYDDGSYSNRHLSTLFDPSVSLEEYIYYAKESRLWEDQDYGSNSRVTGAAKSKLPFLKNRKSSKSSDPSSEKENPVTGETKSEEVERARSRKSIISDSEWYHASRAARTASWSAVFYLITCDILGPFSVPWAFTQLGWGPGAALYTVFGVLAAYSGFQIWNMFLELDSDRYPLKGYGDMGFRIYGNWFRHIVNVFQSLQFFMNVGIIVLSSGQSISELAKGPHGTGDLCFIVCLLVAMLAGCLLGQIRTLAKFGWVANLSVWLNLLTIFFVMGVVSHSEPNYTAVYAVAPSYFPDGDPSIPGNTPPPVMTTGSSPPGLTFTDNINGLMQAVYSYGGATLFAQLLAEMRRPFDFWKGLLCADLLIYCAYVFFGMYVYGQQGQYAYNPAYQGVDPYGWQTVCNVFQLITSIIAACLYGNIGIKVLYLNVFQEFFGFPPLEQKRGKWIWVVFVPAYWISAWVIATSIPQFSNFSGLVAALFILQFTYTFPPFMLVGFKTQRDAILPEEKFDPITGRVERLDSGMKRWVRGFKKSLILNSWDVVYALGALTTAILGIYSAIYNMNQAYKSGNNQVAWSCKSPTG